MYRFGGTLAGWYDNTAPADVCGAERQDRTYSTRGRDVASFETPIILGLVWITRQQQQRKWVCVFCGLCAPIFASILVIVIVIVFWVFRYGRDNYRYRYRYRRYFGLIVPKPFWFRYRTLTGINTLHQTQQEEGQHKKQENVHRQQIYPQKKQVQVRGVEGGSCLSCHSSVVQQC